MAVVDYKKQAQAEINPQYDTQITNLKNTLAQNLLNLDNNKNTVNANYDTSVNNQNLNNVKGKNNFSNTMLGRNLGRSSIVGTGLAEQDQINNRLVGNINTERTGKLNEIAGQQSLLQNNANNSINTINANRDSAILALARQLQGSAYSKNYGGSGGGSNNPKKPATPKASVISDINDVVNYTGANPLNKLQVLKQMENEYLSNGDSLSAELARKAFVGLNTSKETRTAVSNKKLSKLLSSAGL